MSCIVQVPGDTRSSMTTLNKWLDEFDVTLKATGGEKETHVSLMGWPYGRVLIPDKLHGSWLREYTKELKRGVHSLFFAERKTPVFRMHFDLDFNQADPVPLEYFEKIGRAANQVFRQFYPGLGEDAGEWKLILLTVPPKPVKKDEVHSVKSGCHMIWPDFHVDQGIALQLRLNLVAHINRSWPARPEGANSYDDVVDETVLKSNGLRMYGSDKVSKCKACKGSKKCEDCHGTGKIVENRAYTLARVLTPRGEPDEKAFAALSADLFACVTSTSTRVSNPTPTPGFTVPSHAISNEVVKRARSQARAGKRAVSGGLPGWEAVDRDCPIFGQLEGYIRTQVSQQFKWVGIDLKHVFLLRAKQIYICKVDGPGSLYCENVDRAHSSSSIYFEVDKNGISQRCYSPKITNGKSCKVYRRKPTPMNKWLRDAMFGGSDFVRVNESDTKMLDDTDDTGFDPWSNFPHPDFPGLTCGDVARMSTGALNATKQRRLSTLPDPRSVHAGIVKDEPLLAKLVKKRKR